MSQEKNLKKMSNEQLIALVKAQQEEKASLEVALNTAKKTNKIETQVRNSTLKSHMHNSIVSSHIIALRESTFFVSEEEITEINEKTKASKKVNVLKVSDDFKQACEKAVLEMIENHKRV